MSRGFIKLALADEHDIYREGIRNFLEQHPDMDVVINTNSGEGLIEGIEQGKRPDICLINVCLPAMNGYDALKEIKRRWPDIKVLIISMINTELNVVRTIKIGANGFLLKSDNPDELYKAIKAIYYNGQYYTEDLSGKYFNEDKQNSLLLKIGYREMEFLGLCCTEMPYKGIANKMGVSVRTVDSYRNMLYSKLKVNNRLGLVLFALKIGMIIR